MPRVISFEPVNEQGVIGLFFMLKEEFCTQYGLDLVEIRTRYPDALFRRTDGTSVRVEFEYLASNFKLHKHDPAQCDFILCWKNDYPKSPLPVISLSEFASGLKEPTLNIVLNDANGYSYTPVIERRSVPCHYELVYERGFWYHFRRGIGKLLAGAVSIPVLLLLTLWIAASDVFTSWAKKNKPASKPLFIDLEQSLKALPIAEINLL